MQQAQKDRAERAQDKALEDTFPASDPPAHSGVTGGESPKTPSHERDIDAIPTGLPNSDRHATETAHQWEDEVKA